MKRYVRFGPEDEEALRALAPHALPHFPKIAEEFYERLSEHAEARKVLLGPEQVGRLKKTLCGWMELLFTGPWDQDYFALRSRIGRIHVRISLPQRYMLGAMNLIRISLTKVAQSTYEHDHEKRIRAVWAIARILDIELAIMLETFREAFVEKVQHLERLEKSLLERRLAISEARYEEIVEKGEVLIATAEPSARIILFNRRCEEITGLERRAALGKSWFSLFVTDGDWDALKGRWQDVLLGKRVPPYEGQVIAQGGSRRLVRWHFTTLPAAGGPILCAMGIDITEEHELSVRTQRAERMAALGTMAAGLAHEIRNPLNAAHLQMALLQKRLARPTGPDVTGALTAADLATSEMKRLAMLVEEFLLFARPQPLRLARADLRTTAETIVSLISPEAIAAGVDVRLAPGKAVAAVLDEERVKQVILNLVRNAIEAAGSGGHVVISVRNDGDQAVLELEDDGPGLPAMDAPIFEPFFTTKPGGTGLGLSIVHRIVSDHGGKVGVERRQGRTVFTVSIPVRE
ncbi:MAG: PAS domain S-box protein [Deltaproteobacteria bacterium]|nr:PAS domain S-box protein [Deltaproteobacteria bacterium]